MEMGAFLLPKMKVTFQDLTLFAMLFALFAGDKTWTLPRCDVQRPRPCL